MRMLARIFSLPPLEKRRTPGGKIINMFMPRFTRDSDDTYIYLQCMRDSGLIAAFFLFLNWISLVFQIRFDFIFFDIAIPRDGFVEALARSFPFYMTPILLFAVIPFYIAKFRWNIDPKKFDLLWWNGNLSQKTKTQKGKVIAVYLGGLILGPPMMYSSFALPIVMMGYEDNLHNSYNFMLFIIFLYAVAFIIGSLFTFMPLIVLWRYIGPYQEKVSSNKIQGEKQ